AEDGIRDRNVTGVQTCALPIYPSKRFSFTQDQLGKGAKFLKPNSLVDGIVFNEKIINVVAPIKVQLKVKEAPLGIKGDRAQGGKIGRASCRERVKMEVGSGSLQ